MDMIEDNERLLQHFFSEAASQQIDDNGFTERVMQRLSSADAERTAFDVQRVSRLWTWFCILLFVVLFIVCRGWELLAVHFEVMLRTMATQSFSINLMMLFTVVFGLLFVGVGEVISSEIVRK